MFGLFLYAIFFFLKIQSLSFNLLFATIVLSLTVTLNTDTVSLMFCKKYYIYFCAYVHIA